MDAKNKNVRDKQSMKTQSKKPYLKPQLTLHGTVKEITKKVIGVADGGGTMT